MSNGQTDSTELLLQVKAARRELRTARTRLEQELLEVQEQVVDADELAERASRANLEGSERLALQHKEALMAYMAELSRRVMEMDEAERKLEIAERRLWARLTGEGTENNPGSPEPETDNSERGSRSMSAESRRELLQPDLST